MVCNAGLRNVIVRVGNLSDSRSAGERNFEGPGWKFDPRLGVRCHPKPRKFRAILKMMVDSGAVAEAGAAANVLPEKDHVQDGDYVSGGWISKDGKLSCGYSSFRGKRATMEDFYDVKSSKIDGQTINLFGIFDGHGGSRAAEYLKQHLFENLMKHPQFMTDTKLAISETYQKTDSDFLDAESNTLRDDGSTASTAVLVGNHLYVANVGDSRTVVSKAGKAIPLSDDHKPNRSDERKRIENAGGVVMWAGTWRVAGVLAMSRAFGNRLLKQFVVAEPEIQEQEVNDELELLILASDGLWDVVPNENGRGARGCSSEADRDCLCTWKCGQYNMHCCKISP
ncbi:probable protein phosphatase 2C 76 isoform X2 [Elaeis guineensis]|uniref:protein-serine/threonine phosphatase n=1 Tax=Elaeis guineensis var. tenera TaxID=51953 RepID=A0A6I9QR47_ELAGV|nr:probable protein phosphatase 2C member 13, mitochondrial isoform X2 [Elaeis guineensis]